MMKLIDLGPTDEIYISNLGCFLSSEGFTKSNQDLREILPIVTCFSEKKDNILMWSHYTHNHKGICISFDSKKLVTFIKNQNLNGKVNAEFFIVQYNSIRVNFPAISNIQETIPKIREWLKTKSEDWHYENEIRLLLFPPGEKKELLYFPTEAINAIYLGAKISSENKERVVEICKQKYAHAKVFHMGLSETEFKLIENLNNL